jgi:alkyldihydroxyacetonephosphate synthase
MFVNPWGWGGVETTPGLEEGVARARAFFGDLEVRTPATAASVKMPASRIEIPRAFSGFALNSLQIRASHTWGKSYTDRVRGFEGDFSAAPDVVVRPRNESEVEAVIAECESSGFSCIPFGGGSSVVGGVEGRGGSKHNASVCLDLGGLSRVLEVDPVSRLARIEAGAFGPDLEAQLGQHGFTLRHYPQSFEFSTLGGWIATRAGGHYATGYTRIDALTAAARMLTPRGVWQSRLFPSSGAGPAYDGLVHGSEGAFGVITEAWMRVVPRPVFRGLASVHFEIFAQAVAAARAVAQSGLLPSNCRLLDAQEALLNGVTGDGTTVLLLGFESADHPVGPWLDRAVELAESYGGKTPKGRVLRDDREKVRAGDAAAGWRESFLKGPYLQDAMIQCGVLADTFETACTWKAFDTLYEKVTGAVREVLERVCGGGLVTCRFSHVYPDGPAPYFTFLGKAKRGGELEQWAEVKAAASKALHAAGGTITHHHAVGRTHRPTWELERPAPYGAALTAVKAALDPKGILNPGVLLPEA